MPPKANDASSLTAFSEHAKQMIPQAPYLDPQERAMRVCRVLLILSMLLFLYSAVLTSIMFPGIPCLAAIAIAVAYRNRPRKLTAYGTASWATAIDLAHLMENDNAFRAH